MKLNADIFKRRTFRDDGQIWLKRILRLRLWTGFISL